ncbi:hypothetical protein GC163_00290 [bacterium]|nr:hypothetical protein [bacterium]
MLSAVEKPPFFHAVAVFDWKTNRRYRVYLQRNELIFIYAHDDDQMSQVMWAQFGLVGLLIMAWRKKGVEAKKLTRQQQLDQSTLEELLDEHKFNFRASAYELSEMELLPKSGWTQGWYGQKELAGILKFRHVEKGKFCLCLPRIEDMRLAMDQLPTILEHRVDIQTTWDPAQQAYVKA